MSFKKVIPAQAGI